MKRRFGAILMSGVMACSVMAGLAFSTACIGNQKPDFEMPEGGFDTSKEVTITFYHTMGAKLRDELDKSIAKFNVLYPNITVKHEQVGSYNDVRDQITNEIMDGSQPDIAYCYPDHVALFNDSGAIQSLNDFLPGGVYADVTVPQVKLDESGNAIKNEDGSYVYENVSLNLTQTEKDAFIDGYYAEGFKFDDETKMYTLPFSKSTEILYYNKTFFKENNLKVPTTWDEMEEVCEKIREINPNVFPFGYDSESNWFITMCEQYGSPYTSATGKKYVFDNATNQAFVSKFTDWYNKGYFTTMSLNSDKYTSGLFTEGQSYMCIGYSAGASNQMPTPADGVYPFEVGIAPIPQVNPNAPKVISQGPSVCIFKQDDPQRVLASWLFIKYLTTSVDFQARFSVASGYVPVLNQETMYTNDVYRTLLEAADPDAPMTAEIVTSIAAKVCMNQEDAYFVSPAFVGSSKARDKVGELMTSAFTKTRTVDAAFKYAIAECEYFAG